jgi:hypothetical protein
MGLASPCWLPVKSGSVQTALPIRLDSVIHKCDYLVLRPKCEEISPVFSDVKKKVSSVPKSEQELALSRACLGSRVFRPDEIPAAETHDQLCSWLVDRLRNENSVKSRKTSAISQMAAMKVASCRIEAIPEQKRVSKILPSKEFG